MPYNRLLYYWNYSWLWEGTQLLCMLIACWTQRDGFNCKETKASRTVTISGKETKEFNSLTKLWNCRIHRGKLVSWFYEFPQGFLSVISQRKLCTQPFYLNFFVCVQLAVVSETLTSQNKGKWLSEQYIQSINSFYYLILLNYLQQWLSTLHSVSESCGQIFFFFF